jgi:ABC-type glycerol-3-phosphate transport system permease component
VFLRWSALALLASFALFPIYWMVVIALTPTGFSRALTGFWPERMTSANFVSVFTERPMARWVLNSVIVAASASGLSLLIGTSCGYALSRLRFRGAGLLIALLIVTQMMPATSLIVPLYILYVELGLLNTMHGMVIGHVSLVIPLAIWMSKGFFDRIPEDLDGAALLDGCTRLGAWWRVVLPLAAPGLAAIFIYGFVTSWHDFLFAHTLVHDPMLWTAANGIVSFRGEYFTLHEMQMAAALIFALPVIVVFLLMQRWIVEGALAGSVRG